MAESGGTRLQWLSFNWLSSVQTAQDNHTVVLLTILLNAVLFSLLVVHNENDWDAYRPR